MSLLVLSRVNNTGESGESRLLPMPPLREWAVMALVLAALVGMRVAGLSSRGMRLSTTSFIDPAGVMQVTAWDIYTARRFHRGEFPLWNDLTGLGQPHLANIQTAVFYPLKLPFYITGGVRGHDLYLFLRLIMLGLGPFVLLRALGVSRAGSAFGAISFGAGGYAMWFANLVELNNQILTPFLMIALVRLGLGYNPRRFLAVASLVTLDVFGGHPEGIFVTLLFSGLFAIFRVGRAALPGAFGRWAVAGILGLAGAAAALVPFAEYFPKAWNFHISGMGFMHLGPKSLISYLSPFYLSLVAGPMWEIPQGVLKMSLYDFYRQPYESFQLKMGLPYTGLIVTAFMAAGMVRLKEMPRGAGYFAAFWIVATAFSMGLFPFKLLSFLPPFHVTNNAKFYMCEITFSACVLAGMAFDRLSSRAAPLITLVILMALTLVIYLACSLDVPEVFLQMLPAAIAAALLATRGRGRAWAIIAMLICELAVMSVRVTPYLPLNWDKSLSAKWIDDVEGKIGGNSGARIQAQDLFLLPPNLNLVRGVPDISSSDAMFPKAYFDWINKAGGLDDDAALRDFYPRYYTRLNDKALESRDAAIMGVKYLISVNTIAAPAAYEFRGKIDANIYERGETCPAVFTWEANGRKCEPVGPVQVSTEKLTFDIGASRMRSPVVFNQLRYPGWTAYADGKELRPFDIGIPLQAYQTIEGAKKYTFIYRPRSFSIGLWTSIVTIILGIHWFARSERRHGVAQ